MPVRVPRRAPESAQAAKWGLSAAQAQEIDRTRPVIVYSDSAYSIGLLAKAWKAKKNVELVDELRALTRTFRDLRFVKVAGHAGIALNERVDQLATGAITRRSTFDRRA